jgi:hypothetical protein
VSAVDICLLLVPNRRHSPNDQSKKPSIPVNYGPAPFKWRYRKCSGDPHSLAPNLFGARSLPINAKDFPSIDAFGNCEANAGMVGRAYPERSFRELIGAQNSTGLTAVLGERLSLPQRLPCTPPSPGGTPTCCAAHRRLRSLAEALSTTIQ